MAISTISLFSQENQDPLAEQVAGTAGNLSLRRKVRDFKQLLRGIITGTDRKPFTVRIGELIASGTLTLSAASGAVGGVINGVTITATAAGGDIASAGLVVAAINASSNALVANLVKAANYAATITCGTFTEGSELNVHGVKLRAVRSAASPPEVGVFSLAGTTTNVATALAAAINAHPVLRDRVIATSAVAVVTVRAIEATPVDLSVSQTQGTGATISGNLAPVAVILLTSLWKGTVGNQVTLAASGTGVTASGTRLAGGTLSTVITI